MDIGLIGFLLVILFIGIVAHHVHSVRVRIVNTNDLALLEKLYFRSKIFRYNPLFVITRKRLRELINKDYEENLKYSNDLNPCLYSFEKFANSEIVLEDKSIIANELKDHVNKIISLLNTLIASDDWEPEKEFGERIKAFFIETHVNVYSQNTKKNYYAKFVEKTSQQ